ncbi:MAG: TonB C-terminal domain-containing protein [Duganella sp.]
MVFYGGKWSLRRENIVGFIGGLMLAASAPCVAQTVPSGDPKIYSADIVRAAAEISQLIEDENKLPIKIFITPSTKSVAHAMYYANVRKRIENNGTENFPKKNGEKLYGELILYIPIYQDRSLFLRDGGPRVEKSSGNVDLDSAALEIVQRVAPFDPFPPSAVSRHKDDVWVIITRFNFTRQEALPVNALSD